MTPESTARQQIAWAVFGNQIYGLMKEMNEELVV